MNRSRENTTAAASTTPPDDSSTKIICVREPAPTGSHIGDSKTCHTVADWQKIGSAGDAVLSRVMRERQAQGLQGSGAEGNKPAGN